MSVILYVYCKVSILRYQLFVAIFVQGGNLNQRGQYNKSARMYQSPLGYRQLCMSCCTPEPWSSFILICTLRRLLFTHSTNRITWYLQ